MIKNIPMKKNLKIKHYEHKAGIKITLARF